MTRSATVWLPWPPSVALPREPGLYRIEDAASGRFYIGSALSIYGRWANHLYHLRRGSHHNPMMAAVWAKRPDSMRVACIAYCDADRESLLCAEQAAIDESVSDPLCMNILRVAGSHLGAKRSAETRKKLSASKIGSSHSESAKEKMRAAKAGRRLTDEHKRRIGESSLGNPGPKFTDEQLSKYRKYSMDQAAELRSLVAGGMPLLTAAKAVGIARPTARRIVRKEAYV